MKKTKDTIISSQVCEYCHVERSKIFNGKKLKDGSKIYYDENGSRWSGKRCPQCEKSRVQSTIRCDRFQKEIIVKQLEDAGYQVHSKSLPFKVTKDGKPLQVGLRHAKMNEDGSIIINKEVASDHDLYALLFTTVRLVDSDRLDKMKESIHISKAQATEQIGAVAVNEISNQH